MDVFYEQLGIAFELYEQVLRYALRLNHPLRLNDACYCLQLGPEAARQVLRKLLDKNLVKPVSKGAQNHFQYALEDKARHYML